MQAEPPAADGYIVRWRPWSVSPRAAAFARDVITAVQPDGQERAKNLLWAAAKLADWALPLGLEAVPEVLLHPSAAERFTRCAPGLSPVARRTLRTNLRFIGRQVVPQLYPADLPLPRERAKEPYSPAQIGGYLALADAQPTTARRMRAAGLACLGAGAGLIRSDLRDVRGSDVACRSGGVVDHPGNQEPGAAAGAGEPGLGIPQRARGTDPARPPRQRRDRLADPAVAAPSASSAQPGHLVAGVPAHAG